MAPTSSRHPSWRRLGHKASFVATTAAPGILRGVDWVTKHPSWRQQPLQASFVALTQSQSILRGVHKFQASFVAPTTPTVAYVVATHPSWLPQAPGILRGVDWVTKHPSWRQQPVASTNRQQHRSQQQRCSQLGRPSTQSNSNVQPDSSVYKLTATSNQTAAASTHRQPDSSVHKPAATSQPTATLQPGR